MPKSQRKCVSKNAPYAGLILGLCPANERLRYKVTSSLIGWAQTYNQPCICPQYCWLPHGPNLSLPHQQNTHPLKKAAKSFLQFPGQTMVPGLISLMQNTRLTLKQLGHFFSFPNHANAVQYKCNIFVWNWFNTVNSHSAEYSLIHF